MSRCADCLSRCISACQGSFSQRRVRQIDDAVNQLVAVVASVDKESARKLNPILVSEPRCGANEGTMSRKPDEVKLLEKIPSATAGGTVRRISGAL